jgi:hypothetical protein
MATSGLTAGALKPSSGLLLNSEDDSYQSALERIKTALDARENRPFDPHLLAIAQGLLSPTKTGSFGESLGQAAGNVLPVMQSEEKQNLDTAQMRLQLAQAEREQANLTAAQRAFQQKAGLPVTGARPAEGAPGAPGTPGAPAQGGAPEMKTVSLQDAMEFVAAFPNQKELGARMMEAAKAGLDRYSIAMNGIVFDKMTGKYLNADIPGQTQSDFATPYGTYKMTPNQHARFEMAQNAGMGREWMDAFKQGNQFKVDQLVAGKIEGKPAMPGAAPAVSTETPPAVPTAGRLSTTEQEAQAARAKSEAEAAGTGAGKRTSGAMDAVQQAQDSRIAAEGLKDLSSQEGAKEVFGIFEHPTIRSAIAGMVENGRFVPDDIRSAAIKLNIANKIKPNPGESTAEYTDRKQAILDRYYTGISLAAQLQFQASMLAKGQGAISNGERQLFADTTISRKDTPETMKKKADMIIARAEFIQQRAETLEASGMSLDRYIRSDEGKAAVKEYENRLRGILNPKQAATSSGKTATVNGKPVDIESSKARLNKLLNE